MNNVIEKPQPDFAEILRAVEVIAGNVTEVRALNTPEKTYSGYFNDGAILARKVFELSSRESTPNVYWTIQEIKPELLNGNANQLIAGASRTTNDSEVNRFVYLPIDCDPVRKPGVSSTDTEKAHALGVAKGIQDFLLSLGSNSILADSGNGYHVLVRLDIVNHNGTNKLIEKVLKALHARFSTPAVAIDTSVFNPSRILKVYGSVARKGEHTDERPWRLSRLVDVPENLTTLTEGQLQALLSETTRALPTEKVAEINEPYKKYELPVAGTKITTNRNNEIARYALSIWRKQESELPDIEDLKARVYQFNQDFCSPPLDEEELDRTVLSSTPKKSRLRDEIVLNNGSPVGANVPHQAVPGNMTAPVAAQAGILKFKYPAVMGSAFDFVIGPRMGANEGWFPRGDPSLIGGPSGGNKSTLMIDLLEAQRKGESFLGHKTFGLPYVILMADRGKNAHDRTAARMNFDPKDTPIKFLPMVTGFAAVQAILDKIEELSPLPAAVFIEGCDMLVENASKMEIVVPFLTDLQEIARHYHIAIIGSVGSAKQKVGEGYTSKRDHIFGSIAWSRMSETIIVVQYVDGDDMDERRMVSVVLRNSAPEKYKMKLENGRLVIDNSVEVKSSVRSDHLWFQAQTDWFTALDVKAGLNISKSSAYGLVEDALSKRILKTKKKAKGEARQYLWNDNAGNPEKPINLDLE